MKFTIYTLLLFLTSLNVTSAEKVIIEGDEDYPPYCYVENGEFKGINVELLTQAAKLLLPKYEVQLKAIPWKRGLDNLEKGTSFALFPPGLKKEREYIQTYSISIYRETDVLFCNKQIMEKPRKKFPEDFKGLTIGINAGFLLSKKLIDASKSGIVTLVENKGNDANLQMLNLGRIDCYASDRVAAHFSASKLRVNNEMKDFHLIEAVELSGEDTFIGYSANSNPAYKADFILKMNDAIKKLIKNGTANKIENLYLK